MSIEINMYYLSLDVFTEKSVTFRNPYAPVNIPQQSEELGVQISVT